MSQLDRQAARKRALQAATHLQQLIARSQSSEAYRTKMRDTLDQLWHEADLAMGGDECRP